MSASNINIDQIKLIQLCKDGDNAAQRELYTRYKNLWFSICLRYIRSREDAQDVLQNALVKVFSKIHQFNGELGNWTSWSSKVVVNECLQYLRKEKARTSEVELYYQVKSHIASAKVISDLSLQDLKNIIIELPAGARTVFNLYAIEGFSHREIAMMLEISVGSSKSQLSYARKLLKRRLETEAHLALKLIS